MIRAYVTVVGKSIYYCREVKVADLKDLSRAMRPIEEKAKQQNAIATYRFKR